MNSILSRLRYLALLSHHAGLSAKGPSSSSDRGMYSDISSRITASLTLLSEMMISWRGAPCDPIAEMGTVSSLLQESSISISYGLRTSNIHEFMASEVDKCVLEMREILLTETTPPIPYGIESALQSACSEMEVIKYWLTQRSL